jgi:hypothetical protein
MTTKAERDLAKLAHGLDVLSGLLPPARMSVGEKLLGLVAYDEWRKRAR